MHSFTSLSNKSTYDYKEWNSWTKSELSRIVTLSEQDTRVNPEKINYLLLSFYQCQKCKLDLADTWEIIKYLIFYNIDFTKRRSKTGSFMFYFFLSDLWKDLLMKLANKTQKTALNVDKISIDYLMQSQLWREVFNGSQMCLSINSTSSIIWSSLDKITHLISNQVYISSNNSTLISAHASEKQVKSSTSIKNGSRDNTSSINWDDNPCQRSVKNLYTNTRDIRTKPHSYSQRSNLPFFKQWNIIHKHDSLISMLNTYMNKSKDTFDKIRKYLDLRTFNNIISQLPHTQIFIIGTFRYRLISCWSRGLNSRVDVLWYIKENKNEIPAGYYFKKPKYLFKVLQNCTQKSNANLEFKISNNYNELTHGIEPMLPWDWINKSMNSEYISIPLNIYFYNKYYRQTDWIIKDLYKDFSNLSYWYLFYEGILIHKLKLLTRGYDWQLIILEFLDFLFGLFAYQPLKKGVFSYFRYNESNSFQLIEKPNFNREISKDKTRKVWYYPDWDTQKMKSWNDGNIDDLILQFRDFFSEYWFYLRSKYISTHRLFDPDNCSDNNSFYRSHFKECSSYFENKEYLFNRCHVDDSVLAWSVEEYQNSFSQRCKRYRAFMKMEIENLLKFEEFEQLIDCL